MQNFVIDTNFFFNLEIKTGFGENPKEIITAFVKTAHNLTSSKKAQFFMPPRIVDELYSFVEPQEKYLQDLLSLVIIQSPSVLKLVFPAELFYQLIDETRERAYRGLRIGEELVVEAGKICQKKSDMTKIEFQKTVGEVTTRLRARYRQATRVNIIDSVADLDLIVLSSELSAFMVSADEGVLRWGRLFGVREIPASLLKTRLLSL